MRILLIIPAYNEAQNIPAVVTQLHEQFPTYDYIIINDGSLDNTAALCERNRYPHINLPFNTGLACAVQTGILYAHTNGYDMAMQFDADGQHEPQYIEKLVSCMLRTGADIVIGSRYVSKRPPGLRALGNSLIGIAIQLSTGISVSDSTSGMRLFNRRMIKAFAINYNFNPEPDTLAYLLKSGVKLEEVPVTMLERTQGESYFTFSKAIFYMMEMALSILLIQQFRKEAVFDEPAI